MNIEDAVVARYAKKGKHFEILVDCELAMALKKGNSVDINEVVYAEHVFSDAKKGTKASEKELAEVFSTSEFEEVAKRIIIEGEVAVSVDYLRKEREIKRKRIVELIARNSINPKTGHPHPPQRIESALEEAKVKIDEHKSAEAQVQEIISKLKPILPITYGTIKLEVKIPAAYTAKLHKILREKGQVIRESWESDGALKIIIEVPSGLIEDFENTLNNLTKGEAQTKKL
jgi:ribosome maturation protein SDO1